MGAPALGHARAPSPAVPPSARARCCGLRRHPDLGPVEFLASDAKSLLLVATSRQDLCHFARQDPADFLQDIQHAIELGSLSPARPEIGLPFLCRGAGLG